MAAHQRMPQPLPPVGLTARPGVLVVIATVTLASAFVTTGCGGGEAQPSRSPSEERVTGTGATRDLGDADGLSGNGNGLAGKNVTGSGGTPRTPQPGVRPKEGPPEDEGERFPGDAPPDRNAIEDLPPGSTVPERLIPPRPAPQRPALERPPDEVAGANDQTKREPAREAAGP